MADEKNTGVVTTCDLTPNLDEAIQFLKDWGIAEPIISASHTEPGTGIKGIFETEQFRAPVDWDKVREWIARRQRNGNWANIYFSVNPAHSGVDKKMNLADIGAMVALHVDVDADPMPKDFEGGGTAWQRQEIARLIKVLQSYKHSPSDMVISGGGVQAYWRLATPEPVNGDVTIAEDLKLYNKGLERDIGGADRTHNLDRVMRVPGTVNIPTASKLPKGRVPAMSRVYSHTAVTYALSQFAKAPPDAAPELKGLDAGGRYIDAGQFERVRSDDGRLVPLRAITSGKWIRIGVEGDTEGKYVGPGGKTDRSRMCLAFVTTCVRAGISDELIASILVDPDWKVGECVRDKGSAMKREIHRYLKNGHKFAAEDMSKPAFLGRETWDKTANTFLIRVMPNLRRWKQDFYNYENGVYRRLHDDAIKSAIRKFLNAAVCAGAKEGETVPFNPSSNDINEVFNAISQVVYIDELAAEPPCWLDSDADMPDPKECLNLRNGIIHVPTRARSDSAPEFFTTAQAKFDYDHTATCPLWLKVLKDWWADKPDGTPADEHLQLQEMIGYSLLPETKLQKLFIVLGPGGSGKGTINKVLQALVGKTNTATTSLGKLDDQFGPTTLMHKTLCIVPEAAFGAHDDRAAVTNFLKTVSGEDDVTIDRKYKDAWEGQLLTRFWLFANSTPSFDDAGGALMRRLVPLEMTLSFKLNPDDNLIKKLKLEISGILNWALEGYDRLMNKQGGRFTMPQSSIDKRELLGRMATPAQTFLDDCCDIVREESVSEDKLYAVYNAWIEKQGGKALGKGKFIDSVVSLYPNILKRCQKSEGSRESRDRVRAVQGLMLKGEHKPSGEIPF